jgi:hypothetical protein
MFCLQNGSPITTHNKLLKVFFYEWYSVNTRNSFTPRLKNYLFIYFVQHNQLTSLSEGLNPRICKNMTTQFCMLRIEAKPRYDNEKGIIMFLQTFQLLICSSNYFWMMIIFFITMYNLYLFILSLFHCQKIKVVAIICLWTDVLIIKSKSGDDR